MINNTLWAWLFIRACIFFLRGIAPLSLVCCAFLLVARPSNYRLPLFLEMWLIAEVVFYTLVYLPRKYVLQRPATHPPTPSRDERRKLFDWCHETVPDPEAYLQKWFKMAPVEEIKRGNIKEFFCWAFMSRGACSPSEDEELEEYVNELETVLGRKFELGKGSAVPLRLTLDKVGMLHRSLTWYLVSFLQAT